MRLTSIGFLLLVISTYSHCAPLPTEDEIAGIQHLCGGGKQYGFSIKLSTALKNWRMGIADLSVDAAAKSLNTIVSSVEHNAAESQIFSTYTNCVTNLIIIYLKTPDPNKPTKQQTVLEIKPDHATGAVPSKFIVQTAANGMTAEDLSDKIFLMTGVVPDWDSKTCPASGNMPLLLVGMLVANVDSLLVGKRLVLTHLPTGRVAILSIEDIPRTIQKHFVYLRQELGVYADCVKLDLRVLGDISFSYLDYNADRKTSNFGIVMDLSSGTNGLFISAFDSKRESKVTWMPNGKTACVSEDLINPDGFEQDISCEAKSIISHLNEIDKSLPKQSFWKH